MLQLSQHPMFNGNYFQLDPVTFWIWSFEYERDFVEAENTLSCERRINVDVATKSTPKAQRKQYLISNLISSLLLNLVVWVWEILWGLRIPSLVSLWYSLFSLLHAFPLWHVILLFFPLTITMCKIFRFGFSSAGDDFSSEPQPLFYI